MTRVNRLLFVVLLGLVMASGVAFAQRTYPTVETTGGYGRGLMVFGGNISGGSGPPVPGDLLLEDGSSFLLLEDGSSKLCLESGC